MAAPHAWVHGSLSLVGSGRPSSRDGSTGQTSTNPAASNGWWVTLRFWLPSGETASDVGRRAAYGWSALELSEGREHECQVRTGSPSSGLYKKRQRATRDCVIQPASCDCIPHPHRPSIPRYLTTLQLRGSALLLVQPCRSTAHHPVHPIQASHKIEHKSSHQKEHTEKTLLQQHHVSKIGLLSRLLLAQRCLLRTRERMQARQAVSDNISKWQEPQELRLPLFLHPRPSEHFFIQRCQEQLLATHFITKIEHLILRPATHETTAASAPKHRPALHGWLLFLSTTRLSCQMEENGTGGHDCLVNRTIIGEQRMD